MSALPFSKWFYFPLNHSNDYFDKYTLKLSKPFWRVKIITMKVNEFGILWIIFILFFIKSVPFIVLIYATSFPLINSYQI
jgi:hypothetical protein